MASVRSRAQVPVGSAQWMHDENDHVLQFGVQEAEDFAFAARNEVEWLNEHMADIFTKTQVDVTEIFKTPGKLRGKTPRTARNRNPHENRQPLTDIFSTNARTGPSPSRNPVKAFEGTKPAAPVVVFPPIIPKAPKTNTDSGYHGMSEDEMDTDEAGTRNGQAVKVFDATRDIAYPAPSIPHTADDSAPSTERATTADGSFHSAREEPTENEDGKPLSQNVAGVPRAQSPTTSSKEPSPKPPPPTSLQPSEKVMQLDAADDGSILGDPIDESRSPSQGSSPVKHLVRKSSLTFAALPAREPLTTKKSIGARVSRTSHVDQARNVMNRGSFLGRFTNGKSLGAARHTESDSDVGGDEPEIEEPVRSALDREESDGDAKMTKLHNKSSTQRLHDKINMLGKSQPARPTMSIPPSAVISNTSYPELPETNLHIQESTQRALHPPEPRAKITPEEDDDDWIKPPPTQSHQPNRPQLPKSTTMDVMENIRGKRNICDEDFGPGYYDEHAFKEPSVIRPDATGNPTTSTTRLARSASAALLASPSRTQADAEGYDYKENRASAVVPNTLDQPPMSTTPVGTPRPKHNVDGPISASKSKLQSIMKTARGLFTSSAGVSAQAKIEALSSPSTRTRSKLQENDSINDAQSLPPADSGKTSKMQQSRLESTRKQLEGRRTRSSTEKEEKRKEEARVISESNEVVASEPGQSKMGQPSKPTRQSPRRLQNKAESKRIAEDKESRPSNVNVVAAEQSMGPPQVPTSQLQRPKDPRRPAKPAKEAASKPKPQTIRVGPLSQQRIPLSNAAISSSLQESLPAAQTRPAGLVRKPSNFSIQTSTSNSGLNSSVNSATTKPKALLAAERKKEQDEKEAQRKLEQKREIERKRAAQQEEQRQQERLQREESERQRERERFAASEDSKKTASRQLIEKRRLELAKKDQQRVPPRALNDSIVAYEKPAPPAYRPELGGTRAPSRLHTVQDHSRTATNHPAPNPARPPIKRVIESEAEDEALRPTRAPTGPSYQPNEAKRRRTGGEETQEVARPTMAPPIRQSNIRKELHKPSLFNNNYSTAPPPANHHQPALGLLKSSATATNPYQQHPTHQPPPRPGQHPHDMAKYASARPPFADAPNPPAPTHKTPIPRHLAPPSKSSPQFPNGENIHLDDIPTDTDSDASPDPRSRPTVAEWVQSPNLREQIRRQEETMNPDVIFGPQQSPHMEEMFKDRHQRFRNRTSSAAWVQDRLTSEEIQRDLEGREKLRRDGGWTFGL